jgi:hypothetical protein
MGPVGALLWGYEAGTGRPGCWAYGREERGNRPARGEGGSRLARWLGQKPKGEENFFSFSFLIFESHFSKDFEFSFVFESNHSIQKCYAAACMHKHVTKPYN